MGCVARLGLLVPLLGLVACNDPSIDLGTPPPVTLVEQRIVVPLHGGIERPALGAAVASLGGSRSDGSVRAVVNVGQPRRADAVRRVLVGLGLSSALVRVADDRGGDAVVLSRTRAHLEDCSSALATSPDGGVSRSLLSLGSCIQANALASMLADPADLASPPSFQPASGARAAQAVLRWQGGGAAQSDTSPSGGGGESGSSGGQSAGQAGGVSGAGGLAGDTAGAAGSSLPAPAAGAGAAGASAE